MTLPRFFVPDQLEAGGTGVLDTAQTRQLRSVLRINPGAWVALFNGSGVEADAVIQMHARDATTYEVVSITYPAREPTLRLTVGLALLRGERFETAVQKLTELGVARIVPLAAERSMVSFDVARDWAKRRERYARIMREAAEQSERVTLVEIESPVAPAEFFSRQPTIALVERAAAVRVVDLALVETMALAIGPEGGWSQRELTEIEDSGASAASLGQLIYRAETAAIVASGTLIQRSWAARTDGIKPGK